MPFCDRLMLLMPRLARSFVVCRTANRRQLLGSQPTGELNLAMMNKQRVITCGARPDKDSTPR
jgi:hypothetical protein